jgi:GTP-binding protein HflX
VHVLSPRTEPPILISDTVGFIKKLPHDLVASFRSTLREAVEADLLLHVVDASDPSFREQVRVTLDVLGEVGANQAPHWLLFNKIDRVDPEARSALALEFPAALQLSARSRDDIDILGERIAVQFLGPLERAELFVPWSRYSLVHQIHAQCRVLAEEHEEAGTRITVRGPAQVLERWRQLLSHGPP